MSLRHTRSRHTRSLCRAHPLKMFLPTLVAAASAIHGPDAPGQNGSGVPPVVPSLTRAELLRKWDLNSDGKLDAGEVEVAMSKMRMQRAELRLNASLDPVTGKPRVDPQADEAVDDDDAPPRPLTVDELAEKLGFAIRAEDSERADPGKAAPLDSGNTRPRAAAASTPRPFGLPPLRDQQPGSAAARRNLTGTARPSETLAPAQPLTGGVRAGGAAARPGYGSGIAPPSLNAGRSRAATGGLLPRLPTPEPGTTPSTTVQAPPRPSSPAPPRPRRTVEDFEVYR